MTSRCGHPWSALASTLLAVVLAAGASVAVPRPAVAASALCVGTASGCYPTVQAAVDAADDGDTVRLGRGVFAGGVRIAKSLRLVGSGASSTVVRGGGPVIEITATGPGTPAVEITDLTVTGGLNRGGTDGVRAAGGGIASLPSAPGSLGAALTLRRVRVSGNRAEPRRTQSALNPTLCAEAHDCRYASAEGGGIASWGDLTLVDSVVSGNEAGGRASDASGGGMRVELGSLTMESSTVSHNRVRPVGIGRLAEGGGVWVGGGDLIMRHSSVEANRADLRTRWPGLGSVSQFAVRATAGGVYGTGFGVLRVEDSLIAGNVVTADDPVGQPRAFASGLRTEDATLEMTRTAVTGNVVRVRGASTSDDLPSGGFVELDGGSRVRDSVFRGNRVDVVAAQGGASASGGLVVVDYSDASSSLTRVDIGDNTVVARSLRGTAHALAGGLRNAASTTVLDSTIDDNRVVARGRTARAEGGGVVNEQVVGNPVQLTLLGSRITGNAAVPGRRGTASGGGVYNTEELVVDDSTITGNRPDQCVGCPGG